MRIAALTFCLLFVYDAGAQTPQFVVENKVPQFIVENKIVAPVATQTLPKAIQTYLAQPLNRGSCPCGATGFGCHCNPASLCGKEPCAWHNPILAGQGAGIARSSVVAGQSKDGPLPVLPSFQSCPPGGCPQSSGGGRPLRIFRR